MASNMSNVEEYFRMNMEKKLLMKVPEQEAHDLTPATKLLEKRREMLEVENGLNQQKEEFAMKIESLVQRREELARKEAQLKESLAKFDKFLKVKPSFSQVREVQAYLWWFLQENDAKRTRALKKSLDERKTREQKEIEIQQLREAIGRLSLKNDKQSRAVDINLAYQRYMESVLESVEEFGETKDILARYDTLAATNQELLQRAREAQDKTESDRLAFMHATEEKNNLILNYNNDIARLQTKLEELQLNSARWQAECDHTMNNATQKSLLLGQIKMATNNLFNLVKVHLNNRLNPTNDTLVQLDKIQQFIVDLSEITADLQISCCS
ncbi:Cilia- and flagella-associated protein 73 [Gaertneriomyces sp. JEL0708]|nr:Cilia- and flagella-associated protein 73 [Gaertneriomyces sp. JEL0708]